jgi:hypothetical protein
MVSLEVVVVATLEPQPASPRATAASTAYLVVGILTRPRFCLT